MLVSNEQVDIETELMFGEKVLAASESVLGNGCVNNLQDVVYVRPDTFESKYTREIAGELEKMNQQLADEQRPYLLVGFGRWGSSDPWLGIPVNWGQVAGAKVIIEATLPEMNVELSQGSHFFHNLTSFQISYLQVNHTGKYQINWAWLSAQEEISDTGHLRHVRTDKPLTVKVDGRTRRGVILT